MVQPDQKHLEANDTDIQRQTLKRCICMPHFSGRLFMNYNKFVDRMRTELDKLIPVAEVRVIDVDKLQGQSYRGLEVREKEQDAAMTLNLHGAFREYNQGKDFREIALNLALSCRSELEHIPKFDLKTLMNYQEMKKHLAICLVPMEKNLDLLAKIPHRDVMDMAAVYRFDLGRNNTYDEGASILITNRMLESYGISPAQLQKDAAVLAPEEHPLSIRPIYSVLSDYIDYPDEGPAPGEPMPFVASSGFRGSGVLMYPGFMEQAAKEVGGSFYVLPSSVHEVLLMKDDVGIDYRDLKEMVTTINAEMVKAEDRLTNNVYHYDQKERVFETADHFAERMEEKEKVRPSVRILLQDNKGKYQERDRTPAPDRKNRKGEER